MALRLTALLAATPAPPLPAMELHGTTMLAAAASTIVFAFEGVDR